MPTMRAVDAAVAILEKEGVDTLFGLQPSTRSTPRCASTAG
jgi:glyoxylate carboligase